MSLPDESTGAEPVMGAAEPAPRRRRRAVGPLVYRHCLATRIWHWTNAITVVILLMSGLMILNAHPRLYWGQYGANPDKAWLMVGSTPTSGFVEIAGAKVNTTGLIGWWTDDQGRPQRRAFPGWATIPSTYDLAGARRWHFAFAWVFVIAGIAFAVVSLVNGHFRRDLAPRREELSPRHVWRDIKEHALLRFPTGEAALRYNVLQKLSYVAVVFALLPLMVLTGLAMSPSMNAAWPWLIDLFGGRQSARSIHFILAGLLVLFIVVHLVMVILAGPWNEIRSMITGRFRVPAGRQSEEAP